MQKQSIFAKFEQLTEQETVVAVVVVVPLEVVNLTLLFLAAVVVVPLENMVVWTIVVVWTPVVVVLDDNSTLIIEKVRYFPLEFAPPQA
jgi:hypothetical protein